VALGSVVVPPLPEGLVIGKIEKINGMDLPGEVNGVPWIRYARSVRGSSG
jgi:hypothetical protein